MKIKTNNKQFYIFLLGVFFMSLPLLVSAAPSFDYTPMEKIPGFETETTGDFYTYIAAVYKFGIAAVGIAAMFMIMLGGYMYLTSAGNNASMEKAKSFITDAIVGLVLALTSYLLLYIINPDLVRITRLEQAGTIITTPPPGTVGGGRTCNDGKCSQVTSACRNNFMRIEPAKLQSLLVAGEGCNNAKPRTSSACGYSQVLAKYRKTVCGLSGSDEETCRAVQNNIQLDIDCGAKMVAEMTPRCGSDINKIAKCYGDQTPAYVTRVANYYNTCK
jgi:hypothetical protein